MASGILRVYSGPNCVRGRGYGHKLTAIYSVTKLQYWGQVCILVTKLQYWRRDCYTGDCTANR